MMQKIESNKPILIFFLGSLLIVISGFYTALQAQDSFRDLQKDEVLTQDPRMKNMNYRPGEIIVKFKDEIQVQRKAKGQQQQQTGVPQIDRVLEKYEVQDIQKLFPNATRQLTKGKLKTYSGQEIERPNLHNIYHLKLNEQEYGKERGIIEELEQQDDVEYAEPNYIVQIVGSVPDDSPFRNGAENPAEYKTTVRSASAVVPNDPLYSEQTNITATNIDKVWEDTTGSPDDVIAILDTGVDMDHPDLINKIWVNEAEANGIEGVDDDGNGFVDDIHGWDFINHDNDPKDDNSHGTHVAGIAAAEANNGIGIAGANWHAKVMPIKVFQSSGFSDAATIIQGINYAAENGVDVLNMSFGSYLRSFTMEDVLAVAYSNTVLVAAAGNDGKCIGPDLCPDQSPSAPFYPAAFTFVLGVHATPPPLGFSNFDVDGPVFSDYIDLLNYELRAPGISILSTIPGGNYRSYSGTSMSAPLISGSVALYRNLFPEHSQELMYGTLINTRNGNIDLDAAVNIEPKPMLNFLSKTLEDTLASGDRDGNVDAGETIELWVEVQNTWGQADSVFVGLGFGEFEDQSVATIEKDSAFIGSVSAYARGRNRDNPFRITIEPDIVHNRDIVFESKVWEKGSVDTVRQQIILNVDNGTDLIGIVDSTLRLTSDKKWIVSNSFRVDDTLIVGANTELTVEKNFSANFLKIEEGAKLLLNEGISVGKVLSVGAPDNVVIVEGPKNGDKVFSGNVEAHHTTFINIFYNDTSGPFSINDSLIFKNCVFSDIIVDHFAYSALFTSNNVTVEESVFENIQATFFSYYPIRLLRNNIYKSSFSNTPQFALNNFFSEKKISQNNFVNNRDMNFLFIVKENPKGISEKNNFIGFNGDSRALKLATSNSIDLGKQYWGTTDSLKIDDMLLDFWDSSSLGIADFSNRISAPSDSAHGVVWKVLVNGVDPQDEWENLEPVGIGPAQFDVYFNRPMNTDFIPKLSFGVRQPYTQNFVADSAQWSADSTIWTAYGNVDLTTGDGINRIRVTGAQDPEGFEIPVEDQRFEFVIDAAGAASLDFIADAGLGKIDLQWKDPESVEDLLGYNIYRFENATDSTYTDTVRINNELVTDTTYTDFEVEPDSNYYYQYSVVRTSLDESDKSRVAAAKALTASPGDANGDLSVNVLDVTTAVDYILGNNPKPFIFEASDINTDGAINILDVVSIVDIILQAKQQPAIAFNPDEKASLRLKDGTLVLDTPARVSGFQFDIAGLGEEETFEKLDAFNAFEVAHIQKEDTLTLVAYSMSGQSLAPGSYELLAFANREVSLEDAIISMPDGESLVITGFEEKPEIPEQYHLSHNYPNPFNPRTNIQYELPKQSEVTLQVFDVLGRKVQTLVDQSQKAGRYTISFDAKRLASGVYFYRIKADNFVQVRKMLLIK
ncbi:MAG: S8 family serine peptidase [Gracilimonas sp.]